MEWNEKLQIIIDYVENHLQREEEAVNHEEIARIAGCSFGFFQKVFSYMTGISFAEYIRSRKLTLAGYDLKSTNLKVIDISYKYGYDSPTSFTKAFQLFHGIPPKNARNPDTVLKTVPKMKLMEKNEYSWKLEQKNSFRLVGKSFSVSLHADLPSRQIPAFWHECQRNGIFAELVSMDTADPERDFPKGMFGLFSACRNQPKEMEYSIMVISDQKLPPGFTEIYIPASTWAVFNCKGPVPQAIQKGWKYLHEEWLDRYPFRHAQCPEAEWYSSGNAYDDDYLSQIWIPIIEED